MPTSRSRALHLCLITTLAVLGAPGCGERATGNEPRDARVVVDAAVDVGPSCALSDDDDKDGIDNGIEGCLERRDSDSDGTPDYLDYDSDNDGIPDHIEAGERGKCVGKNKDRWPCDSDSDGHPDYRDIDSDGDSLLDEDEDRNGDGLLGCCLAECGKPQGAQVSGPMGGGCQLNKEGCGGEQECVNGKCTPAVGYFCADGETNPRLKDTFGDGKFDNEPVFFLCRDATPHKPHGRKQVQEQKSQNPAKDPKSGDWHLALELDAAYRALTLSSPGDKEAAATIDHTAAAEEVAGFVLSKPATQLDVLVELAALLAELRAKVPGGASAVLSLRASGVQGKTHDEYDTIQGTTLELRGVNATVSAVRDELLATLLGRTTASLGKLPPSFGQPSSELLIRFSTVRRFAFRRDRQGNIVLDGEGHPIEEPGKPQEQRILVMGAVATRAHYENTKRKTRFIVDDLSSGTAIARYDDAVEDECDVSAITRLPAADILWVVDESSSLQAKREELIRNGNHIFSLALTRGLDFRIGVTNVCRPSAGTSCVMGKLCSQGSTDPSHDGGVDRFLLPSEQQTFAACVRNPPGREDSEEHGLQNAAEAIKTHLPRAANDPSKIRPEAKIAVIIVSDEAPKEFKGGALDDKNGNLRDCALAPAKQTQLAVGLQPYLDLFQGITDPQAATTVHVLGGVCGNRCGAEIAHGYREIARQRGGQLADICQQDLGASLEAIVDDIVGSASPMVLEYVPITSSLAISMDGVEVPRSRVGGFDYYARGNSLMFTNIRFDKGSEVVCAYKRWARQRTIHQ